MSQSNPFAITINAAVIGSTTAPDWVATTLLNRYEWYALGTSTLNDVGSYTLHPGGINAAFGYPWAGNNSHDGIFNAWGSGVMASGFGSHGSWAIFGGGHNAYYGSDGYAFDLNTLLWSRLNNPYRTPRYTGDYPTGVYPDGQPQFPHPWSTVDYDPKRNRFYSAFRMTHRGTSSYLPQPYLFDFDRVGADLEYNSLPYENGGCWIVNTQDPRSIGLPMYGSDNACRWLPLDPDDPASDGVFLGAPGNGWPMGWFRPDTLTWVKANANTNPYGGGGTYTMMGYCPTLHAAVLFLPQLKSTLDTGVFKAFDLASFDPAVASSLPAPVTLTVSSDGMPVKSSAGLPVDAIGQGTSMEWSSAAGGFVMARRDGYVWILSPPADGSLVGSVTYPWRWSQIPRTGLVPTNSTNATAGYYCKLRVAKWGSVEVAFLATRSSLPMYGMRLSA